MPDATDRGNARTPAQRRAARARAAALLGDALDPRTHDDSDQGWSESTVRSEERSREAELRRDVPPHHGG